MGNQISDLLKDSSEEAKAELELLKEMADNIVEAKSNKMAAKAFEDKTLPIVAIIDTKSFNYIHVEEGCGDGVKGVVSKLFDGAFMKGFQAAITTALETFLGNSAAGKQESQEFHVVFDRNALLRVDVYFYKYKYSSKTVKDSHQTVVCNVVQIGVLDSMKVNPQVILFEVSKSLGSDTEKAKEILERNTDFVESLFAKLERLQKARKELTE